MSTKTTIKRIALVAVSALGLGMLSVVTASTANAGVATTLRVSSGPNAATTSVTVVGASDVTTDTTDTASVLIRIDVSSNDTATPGLSLDETVTATITAVPTAVTATKTVAKNGGTFDDTATAAGDGVSDLILVEAKGQTSGTTGATAADGTTSYTNFRKTPSTSATSTYVDTVTVAAGGAGDGKIGTTNSYYRNMDGTIETTTTHYMRSYYVAVMPRIGATVVDQGAYTIQFQLTDSGGNVRGTSTIKVDFVSAKSKADGVLTIASSGSLFAGESLTATGATGTSYITVTLANRDGGLIRKADGAPDSITVGISDLAKAGSPDTGTVVAQDSGTAGLDFGNATDENLLDSDGVYGVTSNHTPYLKTTSAQTYELYALYGNATKKTLALTILGAATSGTAGANTWTATGSVDSSTAGAVDVPLTTKTVTSTYKVTASSVPQTGYAAYYTLSYSGCTAGDMSVKASADKVKVNTDANGLASLSITNANPVDKCQAKITWSGTADGSEIFYATWLKPVATTAVTNPSGNFKAALKSTNKITFTILDQFSQPVVGSTVVFSHTGSNKPTTTPASVITDANGQVSYTVVDALAVAAGTDTVAISTVAGAAITTPGTRVITYATTVPAVAKITAYYDSTSAMSTKIVVPTTNIGGSTGILNSTADQKDWTKAVTGLQQYGATGGGAIWLQFTNTDSTDVAVTGVPMTVTISGGALLIDPSTNKSSGSLTLYSNQAFAVVGAKTGVSTVTATTGTVTATASINFVNAATDARVLSATASGSSVTVTVTDFNGNGVAGVSVDAWSSNGAFLGNGASYGQFVTATDGTVVISTTGGGDVRVSLASAAKSGYLAGYGDATGTTAAAPAPAGVRAATVTVNGGAASQDALDAANDAVEAANAATDAANAAAEAADAATAAAQDAQAAVADLAAQVATLISGIKAQITRLTNLVIKIQKKVNA